MAKGWNKPRLAAGVAEGAPLGDRCHVSQVSAFLPHQRIQGTDAALSDLNHIKMVSLLFW